MEVYELSEREKAILRHIIHQFILTANPVGSRYITKKYNLGLSPATVRNIMADLEETGFLNHPHTSAGRVPTDKGYRFYVDSLMDPPQLDINDKSLIDATLALNSIDTDEILKATSNILSEITNYLACITYPKFHKAVLQKIQILQLSSLKIMVVLTIESGLIKTITLEIENELRHEHLQSVQRLLNERLSGLNFSEIRKTFKERVKDYYGDDLKPVIRVFLDSADKIFDDLKTTERSVLTGAKNILNQPEFEDSRKFRSIVELIEDKDIIIHILDGKDIPGTGIINISIGSENMDEKLTTYSVVSKEYQVGEAKGSVGIIGPKRMKYSKTIAAVVYIAEHLSNQLKNRNF